MLKDFVWKVFEGTGNIENYLFYKEILERNAVLQESSNAEEEAAISN